MTTSDFMKDSDCFKSFTALREAIFFNHKIPSKNPQNIASMIQHAHVKKSSVNLMDVKKDKSVIMAIQNDMKFSSIIMSCRKQRSPICAPCCRLSTW